MDYLFKPTQTISVNPPGGTGHHGHHGHPNPLPAPTHTPVHAATRYIHATKAGHTTLWVVWVMFTVSFLAVYILSKRVERRFRLFHWICATILGIAMVSYLCMATGLGISYVPTHGAKGQHNPNVFLKREVYWARYIDWLLTTPLLLLDLALLAGLSPATTVSIMVVDVFMILTGLFSGLVPAAYSDGSRARWLFYAVSCVAFLIILYTLVVNGRQASKLQSASVQRVYGITSLLTIVLWTAYPIVFALTEGANRISVDAEVIAYAVLDVMAKIVFSFILLFMHSHSEADTVAIPDRWIEARGSRGGYGAVATDD